MKLSKKIDNQAQKNQLLAGFFDCPAMIYFRNPQGILSSTLTRFTTEFGMGSGGSKSLQSPDKGRDLSPLFCLVKQFLKVRFSSLLKK